MRPRFIREHMHYNIHPVERAARMVVGGLLVMFAFTEAGSFNPLLWLGSIPFLTGLIGWCPFYYLFGINTNRFGRHKHR